MAPMRTLVILFLTLMVATPMDQARFWAKRLRSSNSEADKLDRLDIECSFTRRREAIKCTAKSGGPVIPECATTAFDLPKDVQTYAIGTIRASPGPNPDTWYRMYPKKAAGEGWWDYKNYQQPGTSLLLHSKRKHSGKTSGLLVTDPICWETLSKFLRFAKDAEHFGVDGSRSSNKTSRVKVLGILTIN